MNLFIFTVTFFLSHPPALPYPSSLSTYLFAYSCLSLLHLSYSTSSLLLPFLFRLFSYLYPPSLPCLPPSSLISYLLSPHLTSSSHPLPPPLTLPHLLLPPSLTSSHPPSPPPPTLFHLLPPSLTSFHHPSPPLTLPSHLLTHYRSGWCHTSVRFP